LPDKQTWPALQTLLAHLHLPVSVPDKTQLKLLAPALQSASASQAQLLAVQMKPALHAVVQPPQCCGSELPSTSQPAVAPQSRKPVSQLATAHAPALHAAVACASEQGVQPLAVQPYIGSSIATQPEPHDFCIAGQPLPPVPLIPVLTAAPPEPGPAAPLPPAPPLALVDDGPDETATVELAVSARWYWS